MHDEMDRLADSSELARPKGENMKSLESYADRAEIHLKRNVVLGVVVLAILSCIIIQTAAILPKSYPERMTSYRFGRGPICLYKYDAIQEGKDYDVIYVFRIDQRDAEGFAGFIQNNDSWNALPVESRILDNRILDRSFDRQVQNMLECQDGYWHWDDQFHDFMMYDMPNRLLYIRRSSNI